MQDEGKKTNEQAEFEKALDQMVGGTGIVSPVPRRIPPDVISRPASPPDVISRGIGDVISRGIGSEPGLG